MCSAAVLSLSADPEKALEALNRKETPILSPEVLAAFDTLDVPSLFMRGDKDWLTPLMGRVVSKQCLNVREKIQGSLGSLSTLSSFEIVSLTDVKSEIQSESRGA